MNVLLTCTDADIFACYSVMRELRPQIPENEFVACVRSQEKAGYRLAVMKDGDAVVAAAGFRIAENLAWGRFLYVDDLVVSQKCRSRGYGARLLSWLRDRAVREGCHQMHLDSGTQRVDAHRFYEREGMSRHGFHFVEKLSSDNVLQPISSRDGSSLDRALTGAVQKVFDF